VEGDQRLFNQYGVILVTPENTRPVKKERRSLVEWVLSVEGQNAIRSYQIDGQQLFFPNADKQQLKKSVSRLLRLLRMRPRAQR